MASHVGSTRTNEETALEALKNMESLERNYIAIISPNTLTPMLNLKKYGECTLVDPRACIHHYACTADLACILYAHVSLWYFHYMVYMGYISNKTRVVLHCTINDTFVFAQAENVKSGSAAGNSTVDDIIGSVRGCQANCRPGIDVLQAGSASSGVGYMFTQPINVWKKNKSSSHRSTTSKVLSRKEWNRRLRNEKTLHDCQRRIETENRKENNAACRGAKDEGITFSAHVPILVIEGKFNIKRSEQK